MEEKIDLKTDDKDIWYKNNITALAFITYVLISYIIKNPQNPEEIWAIFWFSIIPFSVWYIFFWLFTMSIKDNKSLKYIILSILWFSIGLLILLLLIQFS